MPVIFDADIIWGYWKGSSIWFTNLGYENEAHGARDADLYVQEINGI